VDESERRRAAVDYLPPLLQPKGWWRWEHGSGEWVYHIEEEEILRLSDAGLAEFRGRVPAEEPFIEVVEGTFLNQLILRRLYKDPPSVIVAFLKERGVKLSEEDS
jgi:hypothetical protein